MLLLSILDECQKIGDKLLVFSQYKHVLNLIESVLQTTGQTWEKNLDFFRIDGDVKAEDRILQCEKFNDKENLRARFGPFSHSKIYQYFRDVHISRIAFCMFH